MIQHQCMYIPQTCIVLQYVDNLLAGLVSFQPELQQLLQQLHDQAHLAAQASEAEAAKFAGRSATASRKRTKPEPFNLTQPKPKLQPIEAPLPPPIKYAQHCLPSAHQLCLNVCALVRDVQDQEKHLGPVLFLLCCHLLSCMKCSPNCTAFPA